ncbi:hypothetical protein A5699_23415 [Mycobacterium sp. E802]|uniref:hypothetical protein n=1 Tax=Mycobacterium sp. E802 TaxID=1834152 RepID=UPI0008007915|nr:hypothetical protein [Mycobacterium sp. E802]OBG85695.1 hypothetical protein A5699_23415 [Mycobacterium sp. E802]
MAEGNNSKLVKLVGLGITGAGAAHFIKPQLFESITKPAFPKDTQKHIYTNGSIETAIGLGLLVPKTRKLAAIGSLGYLAYLAGNAVRNR